MVLSQDRVSALQGASKSSVQEAITVLTYDPVDPWPSVGLEEEQEDESTAAGLPVDVLEGVGQPPAYLPQEEWVPVDPARLAAPQAEGSSSDYWALGCYEEGHPLTFLGNTQSSGPILALTCGLSCNQQSMDAWQGSNCVEAGHSQRQDPGE